MSRSVYNGIYLVIFLGFLRKTYEKLISNYQLGISVTSNDGEGCFAVIVGNCPVYSSYNKGWSWKLAADIKKALPHAAVQLIEDESIEPDPDLEDTGLSREELRELTGVLTRFFEDEE